MTIEWPGAETSPFEGGQGDENPGEYENRQINF